jgi:hypothetical protein
VLRGEPGRRYGELELPGVERKVESGVELVWNYVEDDAGRIEALAAIFEKVEANLPALREYERARGGPVTAGAGGR